MKFIATLYKHFAKIYDEFLSIVFHFLKNTDLFKRIMHWYEISRETPGKKSKNFYKAFTNGWKRHLDVETIKQTKRNEQAPKESFTRRFPPVLRAIKIFAETNVYISEGDVIDLKKKKKIETPNFVDSRNLFIIYRKSCACMKNLKINYE